MKDDDPVEKSVIISKGVELEVKIFCYLANMLDADGSVDSAVTSRARCAWNKFKELKTLLDHKGSLPAGERKSVTRAA
jgi:hypothetical protein